MIKCTYCTHLRICVVSVLAVASNGQPYSVFWNENLIFQLKPICISNAEYLSPSLSFVATIGRVCVCMCVFVYRQRSWHCVLCSRSLCVINSIKMQTFYVTLFTLLFLFHIQTKYLLTHKLKYILIKRIKWINFDKMWNESNQTPDSVLFYSFLTSFLQWFVFL